MSDTPRTDAKVFKILSSLQSGTDDVVLAEFAQELEAQVAALRRELVEAWESAIDWAGYASDYYKEKHGYAEDVKKLEAARDAARRTT